MQERKPAQLSRIDWRFLLPGPFGPFQHLVLLGSNRDVAERLKEVGLARRVSLELPAERTADVLVMLAGATPAPADAIRCLQRGGQFYWEVDRRAASRFMDAPAKLKPALQAMGLHDVRFYAARPNFTACQFYFPMNTPASFRWFIDTLYVAQTPLERAFENTLRLLLKRQSTVLPWLLPDLAVAASMGASTGKVPPFLNGSMLPERLRHTTLSPFLFAGAGNRLVVLPFRSSGEHPEVVIKIPKLTRFNVKNEVEQKSLEDVRAQLSLVMRRSIPEPLGLFQHDDLIIAMETFLSGRSLLRLSGRWGTPLQRKIEDLSLAARWLAQFHEETECHRSPWAETQIEAWVEAPIAQYGERLGVTEAEGRLFRQMRQYARTLRDVPFPMVWQHRDFNVWNLLRQDQSLVVTDWEGARPGPPLCDLLHFITHWNEVVRGLTEHEAQLRAFRQLFIAPTNGDAITDAVTNTIECYMADLALDRRFLPLLLVYTWIELAVRRYEKLRGHSEIGDDARVGNRNIDYLNILASHVDLLFMERTDQPLL